MLCPAFFPEEPGDAEAREDPKHEVGADDNVEGIFQEVGAVNDRDSGGVFAGVRNGPKPELREDATDPEDEADESPGSDECRREGEEIET